MITSKRELHAALTNLVRVVDRHAATPILACAHIIAREGRVVLTATDLKTWLRCASPCEGEIEACVDPRALATFLMPAGRKDRDARVLLQLLPDARMLVATDDAQIVLDTLPTADYPLVPSDVAHEWRSEGTWDARELGPALRWVLRAAGHDETRPHLTGVYLDRDCAVATDGHRLHLAPLRGLRSGPVLLAGRSADTLLRCLPQRGEVTVQQAGSAVRFSAGEFDLTTKVMDAEFPPWKQVVPNPGYADFFTVLETERLRAALTRLPRVPAGDPQYCRLRINGRIVVEREVEGSISTAQVPVLRSTHEGDDFLIGIDARYLLDALADSNTATARFGGELDPVRIELGDDRLAVVMPVRR